MLNVIFIVGVIALRHLPTLLNVDVDKPSIHFQIPIRFWNARTFLNEFM